MAKLEITISGFPEASSSVAWPAIDYPGYFDAEVKDGGFDGKAVTNSRFNSPANGSVKICDDGSQYITMKGPNGEELNLFFNSKAVTKTTVPCINNSMTYGMETYSINETGLKINLTGEGAMDLHVGANEEEVIACSFPRISLERLDIDNLSLKTQASSQESIDRVTYALSYVSSARSQLGAYTNRVEHSISYLAASNENLSSAMSRIQDTDMAEEMTNYASQQILVQAATSMLAQANQAPQQALQLIQ